MKRTRASVPPGRTLAISLVMSIAALTLSAPAGTATPAMAVAADRLTPIDLGTLGGQGSSTAAVSGNIVVGDSWLEGDASRHAFSYDLGAPSPTMVDLGTLGGSHSSATAVSGKIVVGWANTADRESHAFAYDLGSADPHMIDLGTLGGPGSRASAVDGNIVVGSARTATGENHAFAYDLGASDPQMIDLGTFGGSGIWAVAVSGDIVVGASNPLRDNGTDESPHAFAYDLGSPSPVLQDLGEGDASAISGDIIGGTRPAAGAAYNAFFYDLGARNPQMTDLGTLGGPRSTVEGVSGDIVAGHSDLPPRDPAWPELEPQDPVLHAYIHDVSADSLTMQDLGIVGEDIHSTVSAIDGDIVAGEYYTAGEISTHPLHAYAYDFNAEPPVLTELAPLGGIRAWTRDVSGNVVVGGAELADRTTAHATAWILPAARKSTTTTIATSTNPSEVGQPVVYKATVNPIPDGGTVAFADNGATIGNCAARPVDSSGLATCQVSYSDPGVHKAVARFSGTSIYGQSRTRAITQRVVTTTASAPTGLAALGGLGQADLSWQPPEWPGTSPISGYRVTISPGGQELAVDATTTTLTVTDLDPGIDYSFDVRAVNDSGPGEAATASLRGTSLSISSTTITYGGSTNVTGTLTDTATTALGGRSISLRARKKGTSTWASVASTSTSTNNAGGYSLTVKPSYNYEYRTTYPGGSTDLGTESATGTVLVRQKVTAQWADSTVRRGQTARIYGSVAPNHRGQTIYLQRYYSGAWRTVASTTLNSTSTYSFYRTTNTAGTYKYRTYRPADPDHASGWTPARTLYVS